MAERKITELEKILAFSLDMICTIDEQGRFVKVSAASFPILGYTAEELAGRQFIELVHPEDWELTRQAATDIMNGHIAPEFENRYIRKDGVVIPILWSSNWDSEEKIMYCIARDNTSKKQSEALRISLEESNKRYEYVTKATSDAIWDWNFEKRTLFWGEGFTTVFGYKLDKIEPDIESWTNHLHPDDADQVINSIYEAIDGGETNWKKEYRYQRANGTFAEVVDRGFVIRDAAGKAIRMVGAMHDISERKKAVAELKLLTEDLYKRNRELHQFAYVVSHNLRSPVANIIGLANLMDIEESPETLQYCINSLKTSIARLDGIIQDLSHILTITDGKAEILKENVDIVEIIHKVKEDLKESLTITKTSVQLPEGTYYLPSHKAYLYSIFYNLISNAIKYRSEQVPEVKITIESLPGTLVIRMEDNGIGIDLERHADEIFQPYKRFNDKGEGKGLGLFLVKSHVEALHGTIAIRSRPGEGTTFEIALKA